MFLTSYIAFAEAFQSMPKIWFLKRFCHRDGILPLPTRQLISCGLATLGIAFEQPHRRVDITYYCLPRSLEIVWNLLKNRKLVRKDLPYQNGFLIAISFAIIAYKYSEE
jgi:hypothetical protein